MSGYTILGTIGTDVATPLKALAEGVQKGVDYGEARDAESKAEKKSQEDLIKSVQADQQATAALALMLNTTDAKAASADADKAAYDIASALQDEAARGLSAENQKKRADVARDELAKATKLWQAASAGKDAIAQRLAQFRVKAATQTYGKTQNALLVKDAATAPVEKKSSGSWLTRPALGPVPGWGVLAGGGVLLGGAVALAVKLWRK